MLKKTLFIHLLLISCVSYGADRPSQSSIEFDPFFLPNILNQFTDKLSAETEKRLLQIQLTLEKKFLTETQKASEQTQTSLQSDIAHQLAQLQEHQDSQFETLKNILLEMQEQQKNQCARTDQKYEALTQKIDLLATEISAQSSQEKKPAPPSPEVQAFHITLQFFNEVISHGFTQADQAECITYEHVASVLERLNQLFKASQAHLNMLSANKKLECCIRHQDPNLFDQANDFKNATDIWAQQVPVIQTNEKFKKEYTKLCTALEETSKALQEARSSYIISTPTAKRLKLSEDGS